MSAARKCDICHNYYDVEEPAFDAIHISENTSMIRIFQLNQPYDPRCGRHTIMHFDVCENCRQDVLDYILSKQATRVMKEETYCD